ncbi:MAG: hypothetical protein OEN23_16555 [Paracoccaceae bacterium]|nr:hypothetical protein [Paracoccaceae bacterium]
MPGTVKVWWHDGATKDVRYNDLPVVNEPELGYEEVSVSAAPASSGPAPEDAVVAIIETNLRVRYLVRRPGQTGDADAVTSKPMPTTGFGTNSIGVAPGYSISFVEG